jgi:hypothetical protein
VNLVAIDSWVGVEADAMIWAVLETLVGERALVDTGVVMPELERGEGVEFKVARELCPLGEPARGGHCRRLRDIGSLARAWLKYRTRREFRNCLLRGSL